MSVSVDTVAGPSSWAIERFGPQLAMELWRRVPLAITAAISRAMGAHAASKLTTNHAFGSARWPLQYEELVNHVGSVEGAVPIRPPRAFYQLVVVAGNILLPWCYAQSPTQRMITARTGRSFGRLARELVTRFGPPPRWRQPVLPLFADDEDEQDAADVDAVLDVLDPPLAVVIIGYACNTSRGLLKIGWGEAALADKSTLDWYYAEDLPIPPASVPMPRSGDHDAGGPPL